LAATKKATAEPAKVEQTEPKFSKEQIIESVKYANRRDAVDALLDDNEQYTMTQVDDLIEKLMKGKVK